MVENTSNVQSRSTNEYPYKSIQCRAAFNFKVISFSADVIKITTRPRMKNESTIHKKLFAENVKQPCMTTDTWYQNRRKHDGYSHDYVHIFCASNNCTCLVTSIIQISCKSKPKVKVNILMYYDNYQFRNKTLV